MSSDPTITATPDTQTSTALAQPERSKTPVAMGRTTAGSLVPQDFDQLWRIAAVMAKSGMMPKGIDKPEQVFVAVQMGLEIGLSPMQAVQNIAVINGRPSLWGDAALALVMASGLVESISELGPADAMAANTGRCEIKRVGNPTLIVRTFTVEDAKRSKLWQKSGPWTDYPGRMLQMRARSFALRDGFPDVLRGLAIREEVEDIEIIPPAATVEAKGVELRDRLMALKSQAAETAKPADVAEVADVPELTLTPQEG